MIYAFNYSANIICCIKPPVDIVRINVLFPCTPKPPNTAFRPTQRLDFHDRRGINLLQNKLRNSISLRNYSSNAVQSVGERGSEDF
jgi:hypothetical protein